LVRCGIRDGDRDDLFQDIFVKVHQGAASYQPERPLHPWLFTIVCNTVRSYLRRAKVRRLVFPQADDQLPEAVDEGADGEQRSQARQRVALLEAEMQSLSSSQRQVILLAGVEKLPLKEVAAMLSMPVNTVKTHLRRARLALAKGLTRRERAPRVAS
jgi:RNA polymerase sigma-70 factor (ECF subfamily)